MAIISTREGIKGALIISAVGFFCHASTWLLARMFDAPFQWWYVDAPALVLTLLVNTFAAAFGWDVMAFCVGIIKSFRVKDYDPATTWRNHSALLLGSWPHIWLGLTAFWVLMTSNIMLMSLHLIKKGVTHWKDEWFWNIEGPVYEWLKNLQPDPTAWDVIYNSCWSLEVIAAVVLLAITRSSRKVIPLFVAFIVIFYVGRLVGLMTPVQGPALYKPEYFSYVGGTFSAVAMQGVQLIMEGDTRYNAQSAVLLGGVSAMPSLHVAMVLLTLYWLMIHSRYTLLYTVPWALVAISSTVVLGWHYILDAVGGAVLAAVCVIGTHLAFRYPFPWQEKGKE